MNGVTDFIQTGTELTEEALFDKLGKLYDETTGRSLDGSRTYEKSANVYHFGEIPKGIYYLRRGSAKVTRLGVNGREVILRIAGPNEFIGYLSLLKGWSYKSSAVCLEKSQIFFVPKTIFLRLLKTDVEFANGVVNMLCEKLTYSTEEVTDLVTKTVKQRICTALLALDHAFNSENEANNQGIVKFKKKDIASLIGTVPETFSRQLSQLENEGLILVNDRCIEIINRAKLLFISRLGD